MVHAHQYTPFFYAALAKSWIRRRPRLIFTEHGRHYPDIVSRLRRAANRLVLHRLANAVNACCAFSAESLHRVDGFPARRVDVIENGIDLSRYGPAADRAELRVRLGLDPGRRYVAMVARFHPVKDHAMLLDAFAAVAAARPDVDLLLVGDGPLRGDLESSVDHLGIRGRVRFLGVRSDVAEVLRAVDLFALTSVSEAASLTLLEAMASRLPVVVTAVGGNPEIVRNGVEGLLVPRGDAAAAAVALLRLLNDPAAAAAMGAAGTRPRRGTLSIVHHDRRLLAPLPTVGRTGRGKRWLTEPLRRPSPTCPRRAWGRGSGSRRRPDWRLSSPSAPSCFGTGCGGC